MSSSAIRTRKITPFPEFSFRLGARNTFLMHSARITGLIHLFGNVVCSVDIGGSLITWNASTNEVCDIVQIPEVIMAPLVKLNAAQIALGTESGKIVIYKHEKGAKLVKHKLIEHTANISNMSSHGHEILILDENNCVVLWNSVEDKSIATYKHDGCVGSLAIHKDFICTGSWEGKINYKCKNGKYLLGDAKEIDLNSYTTDNELIIVVELTFLTRDVLMITTLKTGVFLVSLKTGLINAHVVPESTESGYDSKIELYTAIRLKDGRFCIGGEDGYCSIRSIRTEIDKKKEESSFDSQKNSGSHLSLLVIIFAALVSGIEAFSILIPSFTNSPILLLILFLFTNRGIKAPIQSARLLLIFL